MPKLQNAVLILIREMKEVISSISDEASLLRIRLIKMITELERLYYENDYEICTLAFRYIGLRDNEDNSELRDKIYNKLKIKLLDRKYEFAKFNDTR